MLKLLATTFLFLCLGFAPFANAQENVLASIFSENEKTPDTEEEEGPETKLKAGDLINHNYVPLTLKLSEDGKKYIRFIVWNQIWTRATEMNPGTVDAFGDPMSSGWDIGIRRARFLAYAQISPRFMVLTHWGINNQTFANGGARGQGANTGAAPIDGKKPQLFIHDAWNEFDVIPKKLQIGSGLHYWNGISRITNASTLNFMTMDAPIFNWANIEGQDQFARLMGIYAKGELGGFQYRVSVNKPFIPSAFNPNSDAAIDIPTYKPVTQYYFEYQFLDRENNALPYKVGTYLGTKEIFNIGFGGYHSENSSGILNADSQLEKHNRNLYGFDLFYEKPLKDKSMALSVYAVHYLYDFGPNYLRNIGLMNYGIPNVANPQLMGATGVGNAQPLIGTGGITYIQTGFLLPKLKSGHQVMPYVTYTRKNFERLNNPSNQFDVGLNYFINGHHAKITMQYSSRPWYNAALNYEKNLGEFIIQTHFFL
ncbi:MAG: porin [Luteibaculaceae bacterium]